jgi:NAD(P)-dependent dehydrogenase (short-subunit alcohol dehydrogenase family)
VKITKDFGVRVAFNAADLANSTEFVEMVEAATRELGQVDYLVANT